MGQTRLALTLGTTLYNFRKIAGITGVHVTINTTRVSYAIVKIPVARPESCEKLLYLSSFVKSTRQEYQALERFKNAYPFSTQYHEIAHLIFQEREKTKKGLWQQIASDISSGLTFLDISLDELNITEKVTSNKSILDILLANIDKKLRSIKRDLRYARKLMSLIIRLQYIARETHNRVSESPTPIKKEPPIGGIKVGGKQHAFCHAA